MRSASRTVLHQTSLPITEIAMQAGFGSLRRLTLSSLKSTADRRPESAHAAHQCKEEQKAQDAATDRRPAL